MKSFDEFVKFANESASLQTALSNVPLNLESRNYDLSNTSDREELTHAFEERSMNQFMQILRSYHDWVNED